MIIFFWGGGEENFFSRCYSSLVDLGLPNELKRLKINNYEQDIIGVRYVEYIDK